MTGNAVRDFWRRFRRSASLSEDHPCAARGEVMDETQPVVLERFELVYTDRDAVAATMVEPRVER